MAMASVPTSQGTEVTAGLEWAVGRAVAPLRGRLVLQVYLWGQGALEIRFRAGRQCPSLPGGPAFLGFQENLGHLL